MRLPQLLERVNGLRQVEGDGGERGQRRHGGSMGKGVQKAPAAGGAGEQHGRGRRRGVRQRFGGGREGMVVVAFVGGYEQCLVLCTSLHLSHHSIYVRS